MTKIILHIGTHKTATTTIQKTFAHNQKIAHRAGLVYPDLPRQHHGLVADWIKLPEFYHYPAGAKAHWQSIAEVNGNSDNTVLISTEELSRGTPDNRVNFAELREWIAPFDEVQVVCSLRDQLSLVQSVYFEVFRKNPNFDWQKFLSACFTQRQATGVFLDYNDLYDMLLETFTEEEITFIPFRPNGQGVNPLTNFLDHIGFGHLADLMKQEDANRSQEALQTWLAVLVNRPNGFDPLLADAMAPIFEDRRTTMYTRAEAKRIRAEFAPSNETFLKRYTKLTAEDLSMVDYEERDYLFRNDLNPKHWLKLAQVMRHYGQTQ